MCVGMPVCGYASLWVRWFGSYRSVAWPWAMISCGGVFRSTDVYIFKTLTEIVCVLFLSEGSGVNDKNSMWKKSPICTDWFF